MPTAPNRPRNTRTANGLKKGVRIEWDAPKPKRKPVPKFDAEKLSTLVSARIYKQVTKATIDKDKFQSAVTLGIITPEVVSAVDQSSVSVFPQVFDLNKPAKATKSNVVANVTQVA